MHGIHTPETAAGAGAIAPQSTPPNDRPSRAATAALCGVWTMSIRKLLRYETLAEFNFHCAYCGVSSETAKLVIDHIIPKSIGGSDRPANLVPACEPCNLGKGDKRLRPFVQGDSSHIQFRITWASIDAALRGDDPDA